MNKILLKFNSYKSCSKYIYHVFVGYTRHVEKNSLLLFNVKFSTFQNVSIKNFSIIFQL